MRNLRTLPNVMKCRWQHFFYRTLVKRHGELVFGKLALLELLAILVFYVGLINTETQSRYSTVLFLGLVTNGALASRNPHVFHCPLSCLALYVSTSTARSSVNSHSATKESSLASVALCHGLWNTRHSSKVFKICVMMHNYINTGFHARNDWVFIL